MSRFLFALLTAFFVCTASLAQYTFSFYDTPAKDVLFAVSQKLQVNLVYPNIATKINFRTVNVSKAEALNALKLQLDMMEFSMSVDKGVYVVEKKLTIKKEVIKFNITTWLTRVYNIKHNNAANIAQILNSLFGYTVATQDNYSNALIVRVPEEYINDVDKIVKALDCEPEITRVYILTLNYADPVNFAAICQSAAKVDIITVYNNKVVVRATERQINTIQGLVVKLDTKEEYLKIVFWKIKPYSWSIINWM